MFGGLEVKAKPKQSTSAAENKEAETPAAAPAPASSAFSFLSGSPAPAPAAAEASPAPTTSGFSFLQSSSSPPNDDAEATTNGVADKAPGAATTAAAASSAFDFMSGGGGGGPAASTATTPAAETSATTEASSGFSFLGTTATSAPATAAAEPVEAASAPAATDFLSTVASPTGAAGTGVVFGTGTVAAKPKKKRSRTNKIGAGTAASALPPPVPTPTPPVTAAAGAPAAEDTRSKSLEAAKRAEAFLQEKMAAPPAAAPPRTSPPPVLQKAPSLDRDDEEVAAALEAAKEAQQMASHKPHRSGFGLGGLFRSGGSTNSASHVPSATNQRTPSSSSMHSHKSTDSAGRTKTAAAAATSKSEESPTERLQREQEEAKRAMAEREFRQLQESGKTAMAKEEVPTKLEIPSYGDATPTTGATSIATTAPAPKLTMNSNFSFMAPRVQPAVVPKKKPVVPVGETDTDKFVAMMRDFGNQVSMSMSEMQRLRRHKSGLLAQRFQTVAKQRLAVQQKAAAESQQMAAAEAEDFELADRLTTLLESHEREEQECTSILENISRALEELEVQKNGLVKRITGHFGEIQKKLHKFQQEQDSKEDEDVTDKLQKFSTVGKQLSTENERLQSEWKNLERDAKLAEEEREQVENSISEQAGVYEQLRDDARDKVATLEAEIEEMRRKMNEKQKMVAQLRTEAAGHEEEVLKVRVKFGRQLNRVQQKEMSLQHAREDWEREKQTFEVQKEDHEAQVSAHSDALVARDKLLETLKTEVEMADTFEDIIAKEVGFEVTGNEDSPDEELTLLQGEVVKSEATLSEAKEVLQAAVNALVALETEAKTLTARIPMLEETKKAAAAKRDFKTAGKASKEIKEATARLQECESEISASASERKQSAEDECKRLEEDLGQKRAIALEKEKDAGLVAMQKLADHMKRLLATKAAVCANAEEDSIQSVGALVLDAQIEALQIEGKTYGEKFGGWDELVAGLGVTPQDQNSPPTETEEAKVTEERVEEAKPPVSSEDKKASMAKFRELSAKMAALNISIEEAAGAEDFEKAAELDEELNAVMAGIEALGLTDDEMAAAFQDAEEADVTTDGGEGDSPTQEETVPADTSTEDSPEAELNGEEEVEVAEEENKEQLSDEAVKSEEPAAQENGNKEESSAAPPSNGDGDAAGEKEVEQVE